MRAKENYTDITLTQSPETEMRYTSGLTVYDERFDEGRLVGRYWSATGRIKPERQIQPFDKPLAFNVPVQSFSLNIDGQDCNHGWKFVTAEEKKENGIHRGTVEIVHDLKPIRLKAHTILDGTPFIQRYLEITNNGTKPMAISSVAPWCGVLAGGWDYFPKSDFQRTSFQLGRYAGNNWAQEGRFVWEPLTNGVTAHLQASGPYGTCGYQCPFFILKNEETIEYFMFYLGWSGTWCADILCDTTLYQILHVSIGPAAPSPMRMIEPGETTQTPAVHVGYVQGDFDACVQSAHDHIRTSVIPVNPRLPQPVVGYNHWGYMQHKMDEAGLIEEVDIAVEIGCDLFMVDAGWYGKGSTALRNDGPYSRFLGDWVAGEWLPNDLDPIIRKVHEKKMLFGLWIEPEGIAEKSEIYKQHPDWVVKVRGKQVPAVGERFNLDYTNPEARAWVELELTRVIERYKLDILRIDGAPMHVQVGETMIHGHAESTIWRHYEILYDILGKLRGKFPKLIIENCAGGGARLDLGILGKTHWTEITDEGRVPRLIQILNGMTIMLPPEIHKYFYGVLQAERGSLDTMIRVILFSGMPVFSGVSPKLKAANPLVVARIKHYVSLFKTFIAPMLKTCKVYHHTPVVDIDHQPLTNYCVLEYVAEDMSRGFTGVFKLTNDKDPYIFHPRGLDPGKKYRITFDNGGGTSKRDGLDLMQTGIRLEITRALSSELILFEAE